jgi:hypothetical protein
MIELPPYLQRLMDRPGDVIRGKASDTIWVTPNNASS